MGRSTLVTAALWLGVAAGCATEDPQAVQAQLTQANARALAGVEMIRRSLAPVDLGTHGFGEGVEAVEQACRWLGALESDPRATDAQRLTAVLLQARAWDDSVQAIEAPSLATVDPRQRRLLENLLLEKAFPARVAAANAYQRALRLACRIGADDPLPEILDGIARYDGDAGTPESVCPP